MKNPRTPAGIELATFGFVAQHLNHCATAVPLVILVCFIKYVKPPRARHEWAVSRRLLIAVAWVRYQAIAYGIRSWQPGTYSTVFFCVLSFSCHSCVVCTSYYSRRHFFLFFPTPLSFLFSFFNFSRWFRDLLRSCVATSEVTKFLLSLVILNFFRWGPFGSVFMYWCSGVSYVFCCVVFSATRRIYCYVYVYSASVQSSLNCFYIVPVCDVGIVLMYSTSSLTATLLFKISIRYYIYFSYCATAPSCQGLLITEASRSHSDTPHSVGLL